MTGVVDRIASSGGAAFVNAENGERFLVYGMGFVVGETIEFRPSGNWRSTQVVYGLRLKKGVLLGRAA